MEMNFELMAQAMPLLLTGAVVTVQITALSVMMRRKILSDDTVRELRKQSSIALPLSLSVE